MKARAPYSVERRDSHRCTYGGGQVPVVRWHIVDARGVQVCFSRTAAEAQRVADALNADPDGVVGRLNRGASWAEAVR